MLDAGALTPQEFEALKQKLIFGAEAATPPAPIAPLAPITPASPAPPAYVAPAASEVSPVPAPETPDWLAAVAPALVDHSTPVAEEEPTYDEGLEKRNPLNLVFAIGGALVFLAVVLYLTLGGRARDEHVTSTSQTAADSTATVPEVGPQTAQLDRSSTAPETVRVAPAVPRPTAPAATSTMDSAVAAPTASAPAKATPTPSPPAKTAPAAAISVTPSATAADSAAKAGQP